MINKINPINVSIVILITTTVPCLAYLDPVSGSILIQTVLGGAAAALVGIRSFREKIISFFKRPSSKFDPTKGKKEQEDKT